MNSVKMGTMMVVLALVGMLVAGCGNDNEATVSKINAIDKVTAAVASTTGVQRASVTTETIKVTAEVIPAPQPDTLIQMPVATNARARVEEKILSRLEAAVDQGKAGDAADWALAAYLVQTGEIVEPVVNLKRGFEPQLQMLPVLVKSVMAGAVEDDFEGAAQEAGRAFLQGNAQVFATAFSTAVMQRREERNAQMQRFRETGSN